MVDNSSWFFSTSAQTFAALVGVFGMFALYRLQIEEGRIGHLANQMGSYDLSLKNVPFRLVIKHLKTVEANLNAIGDTESATHLHDLLKDYEGATSKRSEIAKAAKIPVIWLTSLIFVSLLFLILLTYHSNSRLLQGAGMWGILLASIFPLCQIGFVVFKSISDLD